ncbi:MAG: hypothetical protein ACM3PC_13300 [Deltaproteobacteria bacterium]
MANRRKPAGVWIVGLLSLVLGSACAVAFPAPAPRRSLSRQEAADIAMQEATRRGYHPRSIRGVERDDAGWDVVVKLAAPPPGDLRVRVDRWSGAIVRFDEHIRGRGHHGDEGEHAEEHGHGHGRGHHRDDDED